MAGLHGPLPTLRPWPRGQTRTARGRRGSLLLRRIGLSPTTPGRSPGALPNDPLGVWMRDVLGTSDHVKGFGQATGIERRVVTAIGAVGGRAQALTYDHVR